MQEEFLLQFLSDWKIGKGLQHVLTPLGCHPTTSVTVEDATSCH